MKSLLQSILLAVYRLIRASGVLSTALGSWMFETSYHVYKHVIEARDIGVLERLVAPGSVVIDVGANVGFFTRFFARCVRAGGHVISIEPEAENFARLERMVARQGLGSVVERIQAVAAERSGSLRLKINAKHPADHRIAEDGILVTAVSLDQLISARSWPHVSLVKIDVQGAEEMVIRGAAETIARFHPALFLEVDDEGLRRMKSSARQLFEVLGQQGYGIHCIRDWRISQPMTLEDSLRMCSNGEYADFLLLHHARRNRRESLSTSKYHAMSQEDVTLDLVS
jgi:FkbM family methyltransferase